MKLTSFTDKGEWIGKNSYILKRRQADDLSQVWITRFVDGKHGHVITRTYWTKSSSELQQVRELVGTMDTEFKPHSVFNEKGDRLL